MPNTILATKTDGTLWGWGANQDVGPLGVNNRTNYSSPVQIPGTTWEYSKIFQGTQAAADSSIGIKQI